MVQSRQLEKEQPQNPKIRGHDGVIFAAIQLIRPRQPRKAIRALCKMVPCNRSWSTQVEKVWLWDDYPGRWGRDCGIDLVFKHKNGQTWAVQAKCYSPSYEITKPDVDKFLSESNRKVIDHRLLIATTDRIGANAKQVIDAQEKPVVQYLRTHIDNASVDYPEDIDSLPRGKRKAPQRLSTKSSRASRMPTAAN